MGNACGRGRQCLGSGDSDSVRVTSSQREAIPHGGIRQHLVGEHDMSDDIAKVYNVDTHQLGAGAYGTVTKAIHRQTKAVRAVKAMRKSKKANEIQALQMEIQIMKSLDHPHICKLHEVFEDAKKHYLVMELCTGGELFDRIVEAGCFTEQDAARLMKQILASVQVMHSKSICHRDLKPENFLFSSGKKNDPVTNGSLKLIDFGLSKLLPPGGFFSTKTGTPFYVAPQVLEGKYDLACDLWSCGCILFVLMCGEPPFGGESDEAILKRVRSGQYAFTSPEWASVTDDAKDLIQQLLKKDPRNRITSPKALQHRWVRETAPQAQNQLSNNLVKNLRGFKAQGQFKQAALHIIAGQLDEAKIGALRETFLALDADGDGQLTIKEIKDGLADASLDIPQDLKKVMDEIDADGNGGIDYTEFLAATLDRKIYLQEDAIRGAFAVFDRDGDGQITPEELQLVLQSEDVAAAGINPEAIQRLLQDADENGDGVIDFEEFMTMMKQGGGSAMLGVDASASDVGDICTYKKR